MTEDDARIDPNGPEALPGEPSASAETPPVSPAETASPYAAQQALGAQPYGPTPIPSSYGWPPAFPTPVQAQFPGPGWPQSMGPWVAPTAHPAPGWGYGPGYRPGYGPGFVPAPGAGFAPRFGPGYMQTPYAPPGPRPGLLWGGIGARFGALVIDAVLIGCSLFGLGLVLSAIGTGSTTRSDNTAATAAAVVWWLLVFIYNPLCWYVFGATPGQKALGLRVAQASTGRSLGIGAVLVRYLVFFTVTVAFPLGVVSAAIASKDPFKRAWHDELARSVVVRK
jgi:uncharacterized RDD family membrane protein YckC